MNKKSALDELLRPVGARPLKSAMDTLRPFLSGAKVLDLYAGSGRFGVGAAQEGADHVTLVELNSNCLTSIRKDLARLKADGAVVHCDTFLFLTKAAREAAQFDIIFADPPFRDWGPALEKKLFNGVAAISAPEAIFLVKIPSQVVASESNFGYSQWKQSRFGESQLVYFKYGQSKENSK